MSMFREWLIRLIVGKYVVPVTHIFAEAFDVLKQLPSLQ